MLEDGILPWKETGLTLVCWTRLAALFFSEDVPFSPCLGRGERTCNLRNIPRNGLVWVRLHRSCACLFRRDHSLLTWTEPLGSRPRRSPSWCSGHRQGLTWCCWVLMSGWEQNSAGTSTKPTLKSQLRNCSVYSHLPDLGRPHLCVVPPPPTMIAFECLHL